MHSVPWSSPPAPTELGNGRYVLGDVLGVGGVGPGGRRRDPGDQVDLAIKVLGAGSLGTVLERRFVREGDALRAIRHPNVVRVHAVGRDDVFPWIAMELVDGGTAHQRVREGGPMPIREV